MASPNREISIHKCILDNQAKKVLFAVNVLSKKDSLNDCDIQAIKALVEVYESLTNPTREMNELLPAKSNSDCCEESQ